MLRKASAPDAFKCAVRALKKEVFGFNFDYPLYTVPEAAAKNSLHYYLYSNELSWEAMRMDAHGIPQTWYRVTGTAYWPSYIAWYGLVQLGHYLRRGDEANLNAFLKQVAWLEENAVTRADGAVIWPMNFDYPNGAIVLKAPWISAYTQGLAISALVRAWRLTGRPELLELLKKSAKVFELDVEDSGVRVSLDGRTLYTEVPGGPVPGIMDGFMTSLIGLHDLYVETGDAAVGGLFEEGIAGLKYALPRWDYRNKWSLYGCGAYLSPPAYHNLNCLLLEVLGRLSGESLLTEYAQNWSPKKLSTLGRTEVYLGFVVTKNVNRARHRTWRQKAEKVSSPSHCGLRRYRWRGRLWTQVSGEVTARDKAPVFVVGSARSGNTMLYHMLLSSGHFPVYRTEPCVFDLLLPRFGNFRSVSNRRELMHCWLRTRQFRLSRLTAEPITERVVNSVSSGGEFLRAVMDEMASAGGFRRWAVWGPDNLLYIPVIKQQIPDALFIHVIRDGRDAAHALDTRGFIRPFPWDRGQRLEVSALHWKWKVETGRCYGRAIGPDYMEVRFEDLVVRPEEALAKVGKFIGDNLDYEKIRRSKIGAMGLPNTSFAEEWKAGNFSPVDRWKRQLPEDEVAHLEELVGELLVDLGYPLSRPVRTGISMRLRAMRTLYPAFYRLKEWLKDRTAMGRLVNLNRLYIDGHEDSNDVEEGAEMRDGTGVLSEAPPAFSRPAHSRLRTRKLIEP